MIDDVYYIEAAEDYVEICTESKKYLKQKTMKYYEKALPDHFMRIHRSYIVNLRMLSEMTPYGKETVVLGLKNGASVHASKSGTVALRKIFR